ncbi:MAG: Peptidase hyicolysin [Gemmatimonadetes bacterium]|nr:Peptidase hyicolysin [Gemmatimonadota bacterium]
MPNRSVSFMAAALLWATACGSTESTGVVTPPPSQGISLLAGGSAPVINGQAVTLNSGTTGGEYLLVVTDTATAGTGTSAYQVAASGVAAAGTVSAPAASRTPTADLLSTGASATTPRLDISYGARLNERYRARFNARLSTVNAAMAASRSIGRSAASIIVPQVGDVVTYNVGDDPCDTIVNRPSRIVAVGSQAIVAIDTLNPPSGFTSADYQRIAANFDTLVYPVDVANFGAPTDIDQNGHIVLLFTRAVNALTPRNSDSYVGGFFFSRDLFPKIATQQLAACAGSNVGELFYLLAPDPTGVVNGNVRTTGFVDSLSTSLIGHEFQHLINASRRIFVNNANALEVVWLNEGLSHIAEELLFYRQAGLAPRQNLTATVIRSSAIARDAFNRDQASNVGRYRDYLVAPSANSPIRRDDSLATRGATWNFLRYATDRSLRGGGQDATIFQALVNSTTTGMPNLRAVYGADIGGMLRDWSVSHYTDDAVAGIAVDLLQPSWNWHDIYPALGGGGGTYPLTTLSLTASGANGTVIPGGSAFYRFAISANGSANITVSGGTSTAGFATGTIVRIR